MDINTPALTQEELDEVLADLEAMLLTEDLLKRDAERLTKQRVR